MDTYQHAQNPPLSAGTFTKDQADYREAAPHYISPSGEVMAESYMFRIRKHPDGSASMDEMEPSNCGWIDQGGNGSGYLWQRRHA